jgi:SSS family solute:Na+ symporter
MKLSIIDITIILIYFLVILFVGFKAKIKKQSINEENYLLAGRKITLPFFVASLVATWYGNILGIGEFVYRSGIVAWICFGVPYYISAFLFAIFIASKIRNLGFNSIPEQISNTFGAKSGFFASIVVLLITLPAAYILMLGEIFQIISGQNLLFSIIIVTVLSLIYLFWGGLKSDIWTNSIQFILMYAGFFVLLIFAFVTFGSLSDMILKLPQRHLTVLGDKSIQYVAAWFIISLQTFVDPSFHQRCAASLNSKTARNGVLFSIAFWIIFDLLTLITGLYAKAYLNINDPLQTYPMLAEKVLPEFWKGIFVVSILSVIMSTLDSYAFISAATIGKDILKNFRRFSKFSTIRLTQVGLLITMVFSIVIALALPSVIDIIYKTSSVAIPGLLLPVLLTYFPKYKFNSKLINWAIILPVTISLFWVFAQLFLSDKFSIFLQFEPMMPGIFVSFIFVIVFLRREIDNI